MGHVRYLRKHGTLPRLSAAVPFVGRLAQDLVARNKASWRGSWLGWAQGWSQGRPAMTHVVSPAVSVIIPVFACAPNIRDYLDGVLAQTWSDLEVVCVAAGSIGATRAILDDCRDHDTRVRVAAVDDRSLAAALNEGLQLARGRYLWFLESGGPGDNDLCTAAVEQAEASQADVVVCRFAARQAASGTRFTIFALPAAARRRSGLKIDKRSCEGNFAEAGGTRLYRAAFIRRHTIHFSEACSSPEAAFAAQAMKMTQRVALVE